jgi:hypothetical protein
MSKSYKDGEPSDLDVTSPLYLLADAHHALTQLKE